MEKLADIMTGLDLVYHRMPKKWEKWGKNDIQNRLRDEQPELVEFAEVQSQGHYIQDEW